MSDRIVLHDMVFQGRHGVSAAEQRNDQPFHVDVEMVLNLQPAAVEDDLGHTVDYGAVFEVARTVVESTSYRLIEALARTFGVPPAFFFDDYGEQASLLQEQVELLALVRDARISSAQLRAILELSPQARQAIVTLAEATARHDTRRQHGEHGAAG